MKIGMIPAGGRGSRMMSLTDNYPKALMPYNHKPIIGWQLDEMTQSCDIIVIIVSYQKDKIIDYVNNNYQGYDIRFIEQKILDGLASSIGIGFDALLQDEIDNSSILIYLSDVFIKNSNFDLDEDFVVSSEVNDWTRWCMVQKDEDDNVLALYDKPSEKPNTNLNLVGVYNFSSASLLNSTIQQQLFFNEKIHGEFQLSSSIREYIKFIKIKTEIVPTDDIVDLGEVDRINNISDNISRSFNNIELLDDNTILKTSINTKKVHNEYEWYRGVNEMLNDFTPNIISETENGYKMERITLPQVQDMMMFQHTSYDQWEKIINSIKDYVFRTRVAWPLYVDSDADSDVIIKDDDQKMLLAKTEDRTKDLIELFPYKTYTINGKIYNNPLYNMDYIYYYINRIIDTADANRYMSILHGDLFFGNMMFDEENEKIKVIDPRGSYGSEPLVGDIRYDIAKLNHSINGKYDFIVNDVYSLNYEYSKIDYMIYEANHDELTSLFSNFLLEEDFNVKEINFITGILFLTMIPLHDDSYSHQVMQFAKASEFLDEFIGGV